VTLRVSGESGDTEADVAVTTGLRAPGRPELRRRETAASRRRPLASRARAAGLGSALLAAGITIAVTVIPGIQFAYRRPVLRVGLETAEALVALLIAYLVIGRLRRSRSLDDLVLAVALGTLALGNLCFGAIPALVAEGQPAPVASWAGVGTRILGALLFAAAAFIPRRRLVRLGRAGLAGAGAAGLGVLLTVSGLWVVRDRLPLLTNAGDAKARPDLFGYQGLFAVQVIVIVLYIIAAVGYARRADQRPDDNLLLWLGAAAVFAAYAWMNYFLSPALLYADWVYAADVFRLLFYLMLLVGAVNEINDYWRRSARLAVLEERRRLARDLHDGLAQEVAYISRAAKRLRHPEPDGDLVERLEAAAGRALRESRQVIAALATPVEEPLEAVLTRVAEDAAARFGAEVDVDVTSGIRLDAARAEALLRIAGEAVTNAARHSGTRRVRVALQLRRGRPYLEVVDLGAGFVPEAAPAVQLGFGLTSMRERAATVGAELRIQSAPEAGTSVKVRF
jgi:signal transduction histidine kinase